VPSACGAPGTSQDPTPSLRWQENRGEPFGDIAPLRNSRGRRAVRTAAPTKSLALDHTDFREGVIGRRRSTQVADSVRTMFRKSLDLRSGRRGSLQPVSIDLAGVRHGRVHGRYYRENFAQGGIDLVQILPELVTNADAAIAATRAESGRIELAIDRPSEDLRRRWREAMAALEAPALIDWRWELTCTDDGEGIDADMVDRCLGWLGAEPGHGAQRGLFGRGLRDVWLAQGAGRIEGIRDERFVESWFFPAAGDGPFDFIHVRDEPVTAAHRTALGLRDSGTRVSVPLALSRLPRPGRLRSMVAGLVQLRPVLEDPSRELLLALPGRSTERVVYPAPEPDPERPLLLEKELDLGFYID